MTLFCRLIFMMWIAIGVGVAIAKDGEPKNESYSFGLTAITTVIQIVLLWGGGFFS